MAKIVLVVEDDNNLRSMLSGLLAAFTEVKEAGDGEEAVSKIMDHMPDLLVLDLMLPKLDGFQVLERIRNYPDKKIAEIKVVVFSNLWSDKDILQAKALKVDDYFVKSHSTPEEVVAKIRQILSGK